MIPKLHRKDFDIRFRTVARTPDDPAQAVEHLLESSVNFVNFVELFQRSFPVVPVFGLSGCTAVLMELFMQTDRLSEFRRTRDAGILLFRYPFSKLTAFRIVELCDLQPLEIGKIIINAPCKDQMIYFKNSDPIQCRDLCIMSHHIASCPVDIAGDME